MEYLSVDAIKESYPEPPLRLEASSQRAGPDLPRLCLLCWRSAVTVYESPEYSLCPARSTLSFSASPSGLLA